MIDLKKLNHLTDKQTIILFWFLQDPSGTGEDIDEWLTKQNLWKAYSQLMRKLEKIYKQTPEETRKKYY